MADKQMQIIAFYEFKDMSALGDLGVLRERLKGLFKETGVRGTLILAAEGFNGMICGEPSQIEAFIPHAEQMLKTQLSLKTSFHDQAPFRKIDVKVKAEIVTLRHNVDISLGVGTHVDASEWNRLISDPETLVLDTRNQYEYQVGTFKRAVDPGVKRFSDLPAFVSENLDPERHKRVAMFCTGGIRCEKFAPYLKQAGFEEVYQLDGGILRYLEETDAEDSLWEGECFVFDERITVDQNLKKGSAPDLSLRHPDPNDESVS